MSKLLKLRCSSLPLGMICPGSVREPEQKVRIEIDGGSMGSAAHELLAGLPESGKAYWDNVPEVADKWFKVNPGGHETPEAFAEELRLLCALGTKLWGVVRDSFPNATTEHYFETEFRGLGFALTGHIDLISAGPTTRFGDWKCGRVDTSPEHQIRGYGVLILRNILTTEVTGTALWVRDKTIENYTMSPDDIDQFAIQIAERIVEWDGTYYPGDHCGLCPRRHECTALNVHNKALVSTFVTEADRLVDDGLDRLLTAMTPERKYKLYRQAKLAANLSDAVIKAIRSDVIAHGPIVHGGKRLTVVQEARKNVDPVAAQAILAEHGFTPEMIGRVLHVGRTDMHREARAIAPYRGGAAAIRDLESALQDAGAVTETYIQKLKESRA